MLFPAAAGASSALRRQVRLASWIGSLLGLGVGIGAGRFVPMAAPAGQIPGLAASLGFDPRGYLLRLLLLAACPLAGALIATSFTRLATRRRSHGATVPGPRPPSARTRISETRWGKLSLPPAIVAHAITTWIFFAAALGPRPDGASSLLLIGLLPVSAGLAWLLGSGDLERGAGFLSCSVLVLPLGFWSGRPAGSNAMAAAAALALPALGRALFGREARALGLLRTLTVVVLLPGSITALAAAAAMNWRLADIFEDGHLLLPASEYLRGELPYRDIVPGHGLVSDGLMQVLELKAFGDDYRGLRRGEKIEGILFWPSMYALGCAATASPALGFGGALLLFLAWPQYSYLRLTPSLWVLALAIHGSRTGRRWPWLASGALIPVALCVGVEFAVYAGGAALVALWVARGPRLRHLGRLFAGALLSGSAIALLLARAGVLFAFVETTFRFLPTLMPAYAIPLMRPVLPWSPGAGLGIVSLTDRTTFLYAFVVFAVVVLGAHLARAPAVGARARPLLTILTWVVLAMVSVVGRRHIGYPFFLVPLGLLLAARWFRGARPSPSLRGSIATATLVLVVLLWRPWSLARGLAFEIANRESPPGFVELEQPPRARGALFSKAGAALVEGAHTLIESAGFSREDTWLDFANAPGLHYLFNRDCPIRFYGVPFLESASAQAEVIAAVSRNPHVRAVLVASGLPSDPIDGIPNSARAPLVAQYIEENFRPFLRKDGVEFWLRREATGADAPAQPRSR